MKYQTKRNKGSTSKKHVSLLLLAVVLVIGGLLFYANRGGQVENEADPVGTQDINLNSPTEEDLQEAERNKQRLIDEGQAENATPPAPDSDKQKVTPVFGYLHQASNGNVEANGYISEAIESNGTCTLVLEKNGLKVSTSRQAMPDAQSTICGQMIIEKSRISSGQWKATITYTSSKYQGTSAEMTVQVN